MDPNTRALIMGAAGAGGAEKIYVEDVFSTWLYTGNGSTQTITNGVDLSGKGGMVWFKPRNAGADGRHHVFDTVRGQGYRLFTETTDESTINWGTTFINSFNSNGFTLGTGAGVNYSSDSFVSWTFRKAAKFFDVATYTGTGANRTISHNLGSVPGCIIVKRTDTTGDWQVYHRSLANTEYMVLNSTAAKATGATRWNSTTPTSTVFSLGTDATVNASGGTYVAYLFAHDAGGFGDSGNDSVVSCGSYTGTGAVGNFVNLGWEPQWILLKSSSAAQNWHVFDNMRGITDSNSSILYPNLANAEVSALPIQVNSNGFTINTTGASINLSTGTYIYIAIRRGPMKTPTDATKVFSEAYGSGLSPSFVSNNHIVDFGLYRTPALAGNWFAASRLTGRQYMFTNTTAAEVTSAGIDWDYMSGYVDSADSTYLSWMFRRAPGFFDVVAYTGTGSARAVAHNLGVAPELIILKSRSAASTRWPVYQKFYPTTGGNLPEYGTMFLNTTDGWASGGFAWNNTAPTATTFSVNFTNEANGGGQTYIAYLFASCPGVSKVGSYTGTGTTLNIDCGFTNGARFVLIKRTDSTGDWYVWDTARGIVSGNDPYLLLNSTAAEVTNTDYIDPLSSGFQISSTAPAAINANGGIFIYLAIA
jgi:hypothetical protein